MCRLATHVFAENTVYAFIRSQIRPIVIFYLFRKTWGNGTEIFEFSCEKNTEGPDYLSKVSYFFRRLNILDQYINGKTTIMHFSWFTMAAEGEIIS